MSLLSKLKNLIRNGRQTLPMEDAGKIPKAQVKSFTEIKKVKNVTPYGFYCSPVLDSQWLIFESRGNNDDLQGIGNDYANRPKNLLTGEVIVQNLMTGAFAKFDSLGNITVNAQPIGGAIEIRDLQITTPASGAEVATVTINDAPYDISISIGTVETNAIEIANYLSNNGSGFTAVPIGDIVKITFEVEGPITGSFSFSSTGVSAGNFSQIVAGVLPNAVTAITAIAPMINAFASTSITATSPIVTINATASASINAPTVSINASASVDISSPEVNINGVNHVSHVHKEQDVPLDTLGPKDP